MAGIIEVDSRGGPAAQFIEKAIYTLRDEYVAGGVKIRTLRLESVPPVPQIVIGVITPVLLEAVIGEIEVRSSRAGTLKAWSLDVCGKRLQEVPLLVKSGAVVLEMRPEQKAVYYELSVE